MTVTQALPLATTSFTPASTATAEPIVQLHDVRHRYGTVTALDGVDLEIRTGELLAVLGPNGAGKTTAISLMLGLRQPTEGRVEVFGRRAGHPANRERIGAMLQESGVPSTLRVGELIDLFRSYHPMALPKAQIVEAADLADIERRPFGVKTHLLHAFEKLGVGDRTSAVTTALERGLIALPTDR